MEKEMATLIGNIEKVIVGKRQVIEYVIIDLLSCGHILIEDIPGVGKTMLVRALAKSLAAKFSRIQFTPDLLPSDITGVSIYNQSTHNFEFKPGPIFANIILADEINRTTPRTQSGLLECMQEAKVTVDGNTYDLPKPFFVVATQNPMEFHGTYPLPECQLDRFLMKISVGYPEKAEEVKILADRSQQDPLDKIEAVLSLEEMIALQKKANAVNVKEEILNLIVAIVEATRQHKDIKLGASPRGSLALMQAAKSAAFMEGRDYVIPQDIRRILKPVLSHRISLEPTSAIKGIKPEDVLESIANKMITNL